MEYDFKIFDRDEFKDVRAWLSERAKEGFRLVSTAIIPETESCYLGIVIFMERKVRLLRSSTDAGTGTDKSDLLPGD